MPANRGIPEVPMFRARKIVDSRGQTHNVFEHTDELRRHLVDMREVVLNLRTQQVPPGPPLNVMVTPQAFANSVQWTRGQGADYHEVLWNTSATIVNANVVNVGNSAQWKDVVGQVGVKRWYWVRARKNTGGRSQEIGALAGTTLASNAGVTPPVPPPSGRNQVINSRTGGREYVPN